MASKEKDGCQVYTRAGNIAAEVSDIVRNKTAMLLGYSFYLTESMSA